HSKWAQIKRQKGVADVKRGMAFTKLANAITIAVRQSGGVGDPNQNFKLRLLMDKAREANMPKQNMERAIERGKGKGGAGEELKEAVYEGFGPLGTAFIAEAATDNTLRTTSEVKQIVERNGGTMGNPGSVSYLFESKGLITVKKGDKSVDDIFLQAADSGAEDIEEAGEEVLVYTQPAQLAKVKDALVSQGIEVLEFELTRKPLTTVTISTKDDAMKVVNFMQKLEDLDDIQKVYSNFDIPEALL